MRRERPGGSSQQNCSVLCCFQIHLSKESGMSLCKIIFFPQRSWYFAIWSNLGYNIFCWGFLIKPLLWWNSIRTESVRLNTLVIYYIDLSANGLQFTKLFSLQIMQSVYIASIVLIIILHIICIEIIEVNMGSCLSGVAYCLL